VKNYLGFHNKEKTLKAIHQQELIDLLAQELSVKEVSESAEVSRQTVYRARKLYSQGKPMQKLKQAA